KRQTTLTPPPPPPNPQPQVVSDVNVRVKTVGKLAEDYARLCKQLPGPDPASHRKLMTDVFARLEVLLPMLEGPNPGVEFRQQIEVLGDAHAQLTAEATDLSPE